MTTMLCKVCKIAKVRPNCLRRTKKDHHLVTKWLLTPSNSSKLAQINSITINKCYHNCNHNYYYYYVGGGVGLR